MKQRTDTQDFLIQHLISEVILCIVADRAVSLEEAFRIFFSTKMAEKLENVETGLYLEGASYFYNLIKEELNTLY